MAPTGWTRANLIPNAPLREAYQRSGLTAMEVCVRIGWDARDTSRLHRRLGLMSQMGSRRRGARAKVQQNIDRFVAVEICRALTVDFDEVYADVEIPASKPAGRCSCGEPMMWPADRCTFCVEEIALFGRAQVAA